MFLKKEFTVLNCEDCEIHWGLGPFGQLSMVKHLYLYTYMLGLIIRLGNGALLISILALSVIYELFLHINDYRNLCH